MSDTTVAAPADKVPAVTKAISIVRFVNKAGSDGTALLDIASELGITKSHCFNILKSLTREGWLVHDPSRRTYALSPHILTDVSAVFSHRTVTRAIHQELESLSSETRIPCVLTRVEADGSFVTIDRSEAAQELMISAPIGHRFPADAPAQMRVRLAYMSAEERESELARWCPVAYTATTIVDKDSLREEILATRKRGYGVSRAEHTPGVMTLAVPLFDSFGTVQMVLQLPGMQAVVTAEEHTLVSQLLAAGRRINAVLGGQNPDA
ncbi:IclR family transcriptional regulator [Aurantimonas sp. A2-1-M11]|uniref:IclR family transcriptional regulator n=1 Tax=Aurantimonas sp. A2-1-M11 TaxID=3113712 RepID=UPI002F931DAC